MTISLHACGSWAVSNATTQTVTLPTHSIGDMIIVRCGAKPYNLNPTIKIEWTTGLVTGMTTTTSTSGDVDGTYMVTGGSNQASYSTNGTTWTSITSAFTDAVPSIKTVSYGNGYWVMCSNGGTNNELTYRATSPNGTWTKGTAPLGASTIDCMFYGNGYWVATGQGGAMTYRATNPTGAWTTRSGGWGSTALKNVVYGGGRWIATNNTSRVMYYRDSDPTGTWTAGTYPFTGTDYVTALDYLGGFWIAGCIGKIAISNDNGSTWTTVASGLSGTSSMQRFGYSSTGGWVAVGSGAYISFARDINVWAETACISGNGTSIKQLGSTRISIGDPYSTYAIVPDDPTPKWTPAGATFANGATANGNGVGSVAMRAFYTIATSASEVSPVIDWSGTSAPGGAVALSYQKASTEDWEGVALGDGGGDATLRTAHTATIATHVAVAAGDMVDFFTIWGDNYAATVPTITQAGVTFGAVSEQPATALSDATSNDMAADGGYRLASSGTSTAAAVVTGTFGNSEQGGSWMTRLSVRPNTGLQAMPDVGGGYYPP